MFKFMLDTISVCISIIAIIFTILVVCGICLLIIECIQDFFD